MYRDSVAIFSGDALEKVYTKKPGNDAKGTWAAREAAQTPRRSYDKIIALFRAPDNLRYLRALFAKTVPAGPLRGFALDTLDDAVYEFSTSGEGRAMDVLGSDPIALRGDGRPAVGMWDEVRRLNRVFYEDRLAFLREQAALIEPHAPRDGIAEDDEPYHMRMFVADSLRPPGYEHLNTPGPLWELKEDQSTWLARPGARNGAYQRPHDPYGPQKEGFAPRPQRAPSAPEQYPGRQVQPNRKERLTSQRDDHRQLAPKHRQREGFRGNGVRSVGYFGGYTEGGLPPPPQQPHDYHDGVEVFAYGEEDAPWGRGDPNRTPEQAVAEYWGDDWTTSDTMIGAPETAGKAYGGVYSWGDRWKENGGTRYQRYPEIPFWQKGGREGYELDIEETLGTAGRELDAHVRRWDMDKLRDPRGQEYRSYGPRSGDTV